jgi:DNA-binding NtrC family response regulator
MEKKTILIVDDSVVRSLLKDVLEDEYHILEASTFKEVSKYLKTHIDLALIEFSLPDASGSEVLNEIRKVNPEMPVILMGHGSKTFEIESLGNKTVDFIQKPFQLADLKKKVAEMIGNKEKFKGSN